MNELRDFEELSLDESMIVNGGSLFILTSLATVKLFVDNVFDLIGGVPLVGLVTEPVRFLVDAVFNVIFNVGSIFVPIPNTNPTVQS
ncbi:MAG: hypothetical protein LBT44_00990 [Clostridiales bacterium]|nr:hypothetical protein [Clostridiales bacterium]